jgi:hypothetical protein
MQHGSARPCSTGINKHSALGRFNQAKGCVVAQIRGVALFSRAFDCSDAKRNRMDRQNT